MTNPKLLPFWLLILAIPTRATDLANSTPASVTDGTYTLDYRLFTPGPLEPGRRVPVILFLHGMGDRGSDNVAQTAWMEELQQRTRTGPYAAFLLAPQARRNMWFGARPWARDALPLSLAALHQVMKDPRVDPRRIYVTGVSMGAYGVWDLLSLEPDLFAAAVPMSGVGDPATVPAITTPVWAFHGDHDTYVHCTGSRAIVAALQYAGKEVRYTEVPNGDHFIWPDCYARDDLYVWLFAHCRATDATFADENRFKRMTAVPDPPTNARPPEPTCVAAACTLVAYVSVRRKRRG